MIAASIKKIGNTLWKIGDVIVIDKILVNGLPFIFKTSSNIMRKIQTGRLYNYVYIMVTGFVIILFILSSKIT